MLRIASGRIASRTRISGIRSVLLINGLESTSIREQHQKRDEWRESKSSTPSSGLLTGIAGAVLGFGLYYYTGNDKKLPIALAAQAKRLTKPSQIVGSQAHDNVREDLPMYTMDEVQKHASRESLWITYGIGVYDITKFLPEHPGSDKVMLAAGNAIDPFWHVYQQHNTAEVLSLLETFRIGNILASERVGTADLDNPWANEPVRHPVLKPASERPFNAEPPADLLIDSFLTPNEFFYVRNHLPVPDIDIDTYDIELEIEGQKNCIKLTMGDLRKFPEYTVTATIMCGGNRRSEMSKVKQVKGLNWGPSAVGNAEWTGVRLRDVLNKYGIKPDEVRHVHFEGLDRDPTYTPYAASIPLAMAMDERGDVLLAYKMNGQLLSRDHGYPVRVVVPGVVGARNVKWLGKIVISSEESNSHWQQNDYKGFSPSTDWDTVDFTKSPAIQNMPVTSAICTPKQGDKVAVDGNGCVTVKGYAWSGGGNKVVRVDVTADGGRTWQNAELKQEDTAPGRHFGWTLWTATIPVKGSQVEIWSKAVDSNYNVQPETFENTWNLRGVLSHAYSKIKVTLERK